MASQILDRLFPSMFQRRLVLLVGLIALSLLMLAGKLGHLTVIKGEQLAKEAESNLLRSQWTPTVRGTITDRKGRVLATDRAAYDVAIGYPMIAGTWAKDRAREFVRHFYREQWSELKDAQKDELIARALPAYEAHVNQAWEDLSGLTHVPREQIEKNAQEVKVQVERMHRHLINLSVDAQHREADSRNEIVTPELERTIQRRANQPIAEMKIAHRILHRVSDPIAFDVQFLIGEKTDLTPLPGETGVRSIDRVERIPGLAVFDSGDREYPEESIAVEIDKSSFPSFVRSNSKVKLLVDGVAAHVVGWMRDEVFLEDTIGKKTPAVDASAKDDPPTDERRGGRRQFLAAHPDAAREAMIDMGHGHVADRGEYREGDRVGTDGIEGGYEDVLRGLRGRLTRQVDTGATTSLAPKSGRDLKLTLDVMLQARVQALMTPEIGLAKVQAWHRGPADELNPTMPDGTPIRGAAVVLDVDSGDILAMVSMPEFTREQRHSDSESTKKWLSDPIEAPLLNRAVARGYPPGSIVKPLILCGAQQRGEYALGQHIACNGHLYPSDENKFRCWIFKRTQNSTRTTHSEYFTHDLSGSEGIMVSCNVFFFTLGQRLGPTGIVDLYREFGVEKKFGLNIGDEHQGALRRFDKRPLELSDATQMGIGQGPVTWTPLHAANAYATLARYGFSIRPRIVLDGRPPDATDLKLDARVVAEAMEGLRLSANDDRGTGNHLTLPDLRHEEIFNAPGIEVWGKTGTAQAAYVYAAPTEQGKLEETDADADPDGENPTPPLKPARRELLRRGDHSWFVVLVGKKGDRPRYAISVVMEYAGSGGKVSGPIINQIIHALITEGYL